MAKNKEEQEHSHEHDHQEMMYEYQMLMQQLQQLHNTLATMKKHKEELKRIEMAVDDMSKVKGEKNSTMIPLGSGIYVRGNISAQDSVLMNVGAGVVVKKGFEEALNTIKKQFAEIENYAAQVEANIQQIGMRMQEIQMHMQAHKD